jgi:hypothetical protein
MKSIWLVLAEIVAPGDQSSPSKIGFMNVTTWAEAQEEASLKIQTETKIISFH